MRRVRLSGRVPPPGPTEVSSSGPARGSAACKTSVDSVWVAPRGGYQRGKSPATHRTGPFSKAIPVPIAPELLKAEQDRLREALRQLEAEQRTLEAKLKLLRQREMKTKREIEALGTLLDVNREQADSAQDVEPEKA